MKFKSKLAETLSLPKEIALDLPVLTSTGTDELNIENYKSLLAFTDTHIRIRTRVGIIVVEGERLTLKQITTENILIQGKINTTRWEG